MRAAASKRGFKAITLNTRAAATLMQRSARKTAANVIGVIKGTNPSEGVIYSAHWDHFGIRDPQPGDAKDADRIFNGAYDNASGCAGVLEIAKAFAKAPQKPARSIYFAFVTAEESGLLGSAFLAANPPLPIDKIAANINIDGVNYLGADDRHGAARLGALVARPDGRSDPQGAQPHADRRHASGARLLLPLRSLLVREASACRRFR